MTAWRLAFAGALALALSGCDDSTAPSSTKPDIVLGAPTVAFAGPVAGTSPEPQTVTVQSSAGTLSGLAIGMISYSGAGGWLHASLDRTSTPATLTLTATTGTLASGSYGATLPVMSSSANNSPQHLGVTLLVFEGTTTTLTAAGQSTAFLDAPNVGTRLTLQAGSQYLIAVVNTAATPSAVEDFHLAGALVGAAAQNAAPLTAAAHAPPGPSGEVQPGGPAYAASGSVLRNLTLIQRLAQNHLAMLEWNREMYASRGNPSAARRRLEAARGRLAPISAAISTTIGDVNKVYVKKQLAGSCANVDSIGAQTVAVGQHVIVLADTNLTTWPANQRPASSFYQTFVDEYDQVTWPHIQNFIGDPLAYDANLSGIGKVTVTLTPVLNTIGGGIIAFVNGCDFGPFMPTGADPDFSNDTEIFYSLVPAANGFTIADWEKELRATAAHETKHLVSFADRIINGSPAFEEIWLEEGLAQESSEIWMRHFNQATWKGKANFAQTVACEINLGASLPCDAQDNKPLALVIGHLPFLFTYLQTESQSNGEGLGKDTPANYGAGWGIARWATDQYAGDEGAFIKSLVNEPSLTGLANLSSHTGQSVATLLMYWNLASAIYTTPGYTPADPRITIPSFNLANIFKVGQTQLTCSGKPCGLFTASGSPVYPVTPIAVTAGAIDQAVTGVPGTAAAYFLLSAANSGTEALQLEGSSGGVLSPSSALRMGVIRVK